MSTRMLCEVVIVLGHKSLERGQLRLTIFPDFWGTHGIPPQHVADALLREYLGQLLLKKLHLECPCSEQCFNLGFGNSGNVLEPLLSEVFDLLALEHTSVTNEGDLLGAKPGLELRYLRSQGVRILRIAGEHFDGDRMPVLVAE